MFEGITPSSTPYIGKNFLSGTNLEKAKETYWGLKDRFWMQIIDAKYHEHGPMVFDEATHEGPKEPGFFASLQEGCRYASEHLGEKPSIHFYKELHKKLCAHFKGKENATEMDATNTGVFRIKGTTSAASIKTEFSTESIGHYNTLNVYENEYILNIVKKEDPEDYERICNEYQASKEWIKAWEEKWQKKADELDNYVSKICQKLNIPKFVTILKSDQKFYIAYTKLSPEEHERITQLFFDKYNQKINELNGELKNARSDDEIQKIMNEKLKTIASFYQMLDWQHPFIDGQGRTDLVLLSKLLTEEGFNPAILDDPYFSSYSSLEDWTLYLIQGMQRWQEEKTKVG